MAARPSVAQAEGEHTDLQVGAGASFQVPTVLEAQRWGRLSWSAVPAPAPPPVVPAQPVMVHMASFTSLHPFCTL